MKAPTPQLLRALRSSINTPSRSIATSSRSIHTIPPSHIQQSLRRTLLPTTSTTTPAYRPISTTPHTLSKSPSQVRTRNKYAPTHTDRGPRSEEDTQTDFGALDVFDTSNTPIPATSIDACTTDGFHLNNGVKTAGNSGLLLVGGEAFTWAPWRGFNEEKTLGEFLDVRRGTLNLPVEGLGVLELVHPKPDLVIIGTGGRLWMLGKEVKEWIGAVLGCRVDVMDTANAAAAYNLLARERGVDGGAGVGALLLPVGWVGVREKEVYRR